ncbi:hypothetical protein IJT93_02855 [bacterium]|nr:hypothetical protein [bacterium]
MTDSGEDLKNGRLVAGIDIGSSLAKIAVCGPDGNLSFILLDNCECQSVVNTVLDLNVDCCGVTGSGAIDFKQAMRSLGGRDGIRTPAVLCVNEFVSWGVGAKKLLLNSGCKDLGAAYLLGSVGTGTSIMLINSFTITRVGGTALGGGTILGLGKLLTRRRDFQEMCALAVKGRRSKVDLLLKDIYAPGQVGISGKATASNFGGWVRKDKELPGEADIMAGIMGMVGENISLIASNLLSLHRLNTVVYAGSTLRNNPFLSSVLLSSAKILGHRAIILEHGEFSGAAGAYQLALHDF